MKILDEEDEAMKKAKRKKKTPKQPSPAPQKISWHEQHQKSNRRFEWNCGIYCRMC